MKNKDAKFIWDIYIGDDGDIHAIISVYHPLWHDKRPELFTSEEVDALNKIIRDINPPVQFNSDRNIAGGQLFGIKRYALQQMRGMKKEIEDDPNWMKKIEDEFIEQNKKDIEKLEQNMYPSSTPPVSETEAKKIGWAADIQKMQDAEKEEIYFGEYKNWKEQVLDQMIKYLRLKSVEEAHKDIHDMLSTHTISLSMYLNLMQVIDNPNAPYSFKR